MASKPRTQFHEEMIPTYSVECTRAASRLCMLGAKFGTDKSPYNTVGHRHPYTAFYNMLFAPRASQPIRFAEIGVAGGASVRMWSEYFTKGELYFFDRDENFLNNSRSFGYKNSYSLMDVSDADSINSSFAATGGNLDVILDDSSHDLIHQKIIIRESLKWLKPGGILLIEDIFRDVPEADYYDAIKPVLDQISFFAAYEMEHAQKWSPGWNNDKILMLVKNY